MFNRDNKGIFARQVFLFFFEGWYITYAIATAYWLPGFSLYIISLHLPYLCLTLQAIIIIAKLSFWINKPFLPSLIEALDQYMEKSYVQKLKKDITPDFVHSDHEDLVTLLYRQVTDIDGRYFI